MDFKQKIVIKNDNFPCGWWVPVVGVTTNHLSISLTYSRGGPSSFPVAEKNQNATAAPDAMKGSGLANVVRAAPVKAEQRLLKFSASVSDKNNCASTS